MTWDASGYGSHIETGLVAPSTTWYFAEGSTSGDFWLFYLLQNPQATAVTATVRFLRPAGAPIERTYTLPPHSRTTIPVDFVGPELASTDVSAVITATAPIVAERAMYLSRPGQPFGAGHESAGVTAPALEWFLAEGATGRVLRPVRADRQSGRDRRRRLGRVPPGRRRLAHQDVHRAGEFADDHLGGRRAAAGGLGAAAARQRRGVDDRAIDQRRADHRRARDVVARSGPHRELLVRGAQLTRRDDHGDALDHRAAARSAARTAPRPTC